MHDEQISTPNSVLRHLWSGSGICPLVALLLITLTATKRQGRHELADIELVVILGGGLAFNFGGCGSRPFTAEGTISQAMKHERHLPANSTSNPRAYAAHNFP
jgi:hypothetical protein